MKRHLDRQRARLAGACYLLTHVTSVLAVVAYARGAFVTGAMLEIALALGCVGTGVLLWSLLSERGAVRAATFLTLRGVEAAVILAGTMPMLAIAWSSSLGSAGQEWATQMHAAAFLVGQGLVIGVNTVVLGSLLAASRRVPRPMAALAVVGGLVVLVSDVAQAGGAIAFGGALAGALAVPIFGFEIWFAIRLIVVGLGERERVGTGAGARMAAASN